MPDSQNQLLYIDGDFIEPDSGEWFESVNPYTGKAWTKIPRGTKPDVDRAVAAAREAVFEGEWSTLTQTERGKYLFQLADNLESRAADHAEMEVRNNGKPIREMRSQHEAIPDWFRYYAGLADKISGDTAPVHKPDKHVYTMKEPVGVVGAITPWNSPLMLATWKVAPALAAGNAVVLKPDEKTSVSALSFAEAVDEVGIPEGVVNIVTGYGPEAGEAIVQHNGVDKISFTGGSDTGSYIAGEAAKTFKRTSMELGGKSPNIVFPDADLENAINGALSAIFTSVGQSCSAGSRLLLHEDIHDPVIDAMVEKTAEIDMGNPLDNETEMGPIAFDDQFETVQSYVETAIDEGATLATGGNAVSVDDCPRFFEPTILTDVDNNDTVAQEEIFGPVVSVIRFGSEEEAIQIANDIDFGLAGAVWTENMRRAHRVSSAIRAGRIWVNNYGNSSYAAPQGGYKQSGWGRENGTEGIEEYLETKTVWVELNDKTENVFE
ncbi:aldehyde dehydrogenase [Halalkalicoccus salilacus]|uniref:aldehyde dehydrogenase n=1 Tax=Halalkalicoccus TaxID=332246 RepID=UPI002F966133